MWWSGRLHMWPPWIGAYPAHPQGNTTVMYLPPHLLAPHQVVPGPWASPTTAGFPSGPVLSPYMMQSPMRPSYGTGMPAYLVAPQPLEASRSPFRPHARRDRGERGANPLPPPPAPDPPPL